MALYFSDINNFESVVKRYEDTKVLVSCKHPRSHDVRPIGDRTRKWERIVKVSRNCYALSDGYHRGDPLFSFWGYSVTGEPPQGGDMCYYAPLVWRKHRDGTTSLRVMNGTGPSYGAFNSRFVGSTGGFTMHASVWAILATVGLFGLLNLIEFKRLD